VRVAHDGAGRPGGAPGEAGEAGSFGRTLVSALSRQLGATTTWGAAGAQGRSVTLEVPLGARTSSEGTS
jgi:two-component sensor histidine kinase